MMRRNCKLCGNEFTFEYSRGRPREFCLTCQPPGTRMIGADRNKAIHAKKHSELDTKNPLASGYLRNRSDAARDPDSRAALKDLQGEVIVVSYDPALGKPTGLTEYQLTDLAEKLEGIDPTISVERMQEP